MLTKIKSLTLAFFSVLALSSSACAQETSKIATSSPSPTLTIVSTAKPFESEPSLDFSYREVHLNHENTIVQTQDGALVINQAGDLVRNISNSNFSEINRLAISGGLVFMGYDQAFSVSELETGKQINLVINKNPKQFASYSAISDDFSLIYALNAIYRKGESNALVTLPRLPNVMAAEFSPDKTMLITASVVTGYGAAIWDTRKGKIIHQLTKSGAALGFFSGDGTKALVVTLEQSSRNIILPKSKDIYVYDVQTGKDITQLKNDASILRVSPISNDNRIFTSTTIGTLAAWSLDTYKKSKQWKLDSNVISLKLDDHNYLWCGLENGELVAVNLKTNKLYAIHKFENLIRSMDIKNEKAVFITEDASRLLVTATVKYN